MIPRRRLLLVAVALLAAACGGQAGVDDPLPSALEGTPPPGATEPVDTPADAATAGPTEASEPEEPVTQTDTEWGRIWDAVPAGFPVYPGAIESAEAAGEDAPASAVFTVAETNTDEIVAWFQQELEAATYSTEALSGPLEDDAFVIDSVGDAGCRIETTIRPAGGLTLIAVGYGADCPFE